MERLTDKMLTEACNDPWDYCGLDAHCTRHCTQPTPCKIPALVHRLAKIENILGDNYDLDRLRELVEADNDGRCVVLPCKIDDDVYINLFGRTLDATVISISELASTPTYKAMYGIRLCYIFKADDVGRTVFLTREAAEEALKAREQE